MVSTKSIALALCVAAGAAANSNPAATSPHAYTEFSTVTGYFLQDEPDTDPTTFDYTAVNFGLINRTYPSDTPWSLAHLTQWERFYREVERLNRQQKGVTYKVLFLGRHGEGWHNAAESYYGTPAWNCYWAELNGNDSATWTDPHLTAKGIAQAQVAHDFWVSRLSREGDGQRMHAPDAYFVSPLTRCLQTFNTTFFGIINSGNSSSSSSSSSTASPQPKPVVLESLREEISIHTCDRRSKASVLRAAWSDLVRFEPGFTECDELWNGVTGESDSSQDVRSHRAFEQMWSAASRPEQLFLSATSHSGHITSMLRVLGHREFSLTTGAVIPVLVRAEVKHHEKPTTTQAWQTSAHCTVPPVSSASAAGCVCPSGVTVTTPLVPTGCF